MKIFHFITLFAVAFVLLVNFMTRRMTQRVTRSVGIHPHSRYFKVSWIQRTCLGRYSLTITIHYNTRSTY